MNKFILSLLLTVCGVCSIEAGDKKILKHDAPVPELTPEIVSTTLPVYSHRQLLTEIDSLIKKYPECIFRLDGDTTMQGREIPVLYFGNPEAPHHVMVQASMHAREYINVQLVMAMLEQYAIGWEENATYLGKPLRELFSQVGFVIMPSVNPDGIAIAQSGADGALHKNVKSWVESNIKKGTNYNKIKANANGVDLNRNFTNGFGKAQTQEKYKAFANYPGQTPYSEPETRLMLSVSGLYEYNCFLNYHSKGNLVYYGCGNALGAVNKKAKQLALLIKKHTGYPIYGPDSADPNGSWADEVEVLYKKPSATIETGDQTPVPICQYPKIFKKNRWLWADLANEIIKGEF